MKARSRKPPWKRPTPKRRRQTKLTPAAIREAKAKAGAAGRPYPNLVDNMSVARKQRKKSNA